MAMSDTLKNLLLNAMDESVAGGAKYMSLHNGDPGETGANELTGGAPAYARKATTFAAASAGAKALSAALTFDIPPAKTVTHIGFWDAVSAGNFLCGQALAESRAFVNQGTLEVSSGSLAIPD